MSANNYDFEKLNKKYNHEATYWSVFNDEDCGKLLMVEGLTERDDCYTGFLKDYLELTKIRNIAKETHKWLFFWFIVIIFMIICSKLTNYIDTILSFSQEPTPKDYTIPLVTSVISLVSTAISIPLVITKYLFNDKEDDNITTIILKTQEHDNKNMSLFNNRFCTPKENNESYKKQHRKLIELSSLNTKQKDSDHNDTSIETVINNNNKDDDLYKQLYEKLRKNP